MSLSPASGKLKTIRRALVLVWQGARIWTLVGILLMPLQAALTTLPIYLSKLVVDAVVAGMRSAAPLPAFRSVAFFIGLQAGMTLLSALLSAVARLAQNAQSAHVTDYVTDLVHAKSIEVDLEYYENARYYDTLRRAQNQATFRPVNIVNNLLSAGQNAVSLLALVGLLISLHWGIAALLFVATIPGAFVRMRFSNRMYGWQRRRTPTERQTYYYESLLTDGSSAKEIRLFDLGTLFRERGKALRAQMRRERLALESKSTLADLIAQSVATVAVYGAYAFAALRTLQGVISLGGLTMYFGAFQRGQGLLQQMLGNLTGLYDNSLFLADLDEFLELERRVREPSAPKPAPCPMRTGIRFEEVSFTYPTGSETVLDEITLAIRPGEMVALVGANGCGKTTLTKLLCRLYDPTQGRITLDGIDLRDFSTRDLRNQISVIFQDYEKYQLTVRENIWLGNVRQPADDDRIAAAAEHAGAAPVIEGLQAGYETLLGKTFEGGAELSVGQWQKIALARAFMREAQVIVLDEPTSAMDAKAEYEFFRDFRRLAEDRAAVLISHRFSTVRMADRIYVLEHGKIIESGSHEELVRRNGVYAGLFEMQAQQYR